MFRLHGLPAGQGPEATGYRGEGRVGIFPAARRRQAPGPHEANRKGHHKGRAVKRKFGDALRSRNDTAMVNEALCKLRRI
jgi:hypothetical protein